MTPLCFNLNQTFKNNNLLSHESEVNKIQEDGDRLVEMKHPGSATITVFVIAQTTLLSVEAKGFSFKNLPF